MKVTIKALDLGDISDAFDFHLRPVRVLSDFYFSTRTVLIINKFVLD